MPDTVTTITQQGLGSRLMGAIKGVAVGLVLLGLAFPVLFWNEGRAVKRDRDLREGAGAVVSIDAASVDPGNERQLVHVSGRADTDEVLSDASFGVAVNALHLRRKSEMYQWVEQEETRREKQLGGSEKTITTYSYVKQWSDEHHDSAGFHEPAGHQNPSSLPYPSLTQQARDVRLGAFQLSPALVEQVEGYSPVTPPTPPEGAAWQLSGEAIYLPAAGAAAGNGEPRVGDMRIRFDAAGPADVSVVALQQGDSFAAWTGSEGSSIETLLMGVRAPEQMFATLESRNRMLTWALRGLGFVLMALGLGMIFGPIAVVADVVPFLGDLLRLGVGIFAAIVAAALSLATIAVGWVAYRPLVGIPLLVLAIGALLALLFAGRARRDASPSQGGVEGATA